MIAYFANCEMKTCFLIEGSHSNGEEKKDEKNTQMTKENGKQYPGRSL